MKHNSYFFSYIDGRTSRECYKIYGLENVSLCCHLLPLLRLMFKWLSVIAKYKLIHICCWWPKAKCDFLNCSIIKLCLVMLKILQVSFLFGANAISGKWCRETQSALAWVYSMMLGSLTPYFYKIKRILIVAGTY